MKTENELLTMNRDDLVKFAIDFQNKANLSEQHEKENKRLKEYLAAVGIVIETYKREIS